MYSQLQGLYPILLSDTIVYDRPMMLYIGTGGSLRVLTSGGDDVTLRNVPDGSTLPILVSKVFATGSTVGNVLATQFDGDVLNYFSTLPSWVLQEYSLAFDAEGAEELGDYEAGTLYFRDSNFHRVGASFSRTTTATRVNQNGLIETVAANVPRIDYTDGSAKLLMEPSRTNTFTYSEDFANYYINRCSKSDLGAFSLKADADLALFTQTNVAAYFGKVLTALISGTTYTVSLFVDLSQGGEFFGITDATRNIQIDAINETILANTFTAASVSFVTFAPNIKRVSLTFTAQISGNHFIVIGDGLGTVTNVGNTVAACCFQLELGLSPTSYIPTAGSTVTRNVDRIFSSTFDLSPYVGLTDFSHYCDAVTVGLSAIAAAPIRHGTSGNTTQIAHYTDNSGYRCYDYRSATFLTGANSNSNKPFAIKLDGTTIKGFVNGAEQANATTDAEVDQIQFSSIEQGFKISKLLYFPTALTDDQCKDLTLDGYDSYEAMAAALGYTTY